MEKRIKSPLISVIVPIYNVEKYLPRCVESLLNQEYKNLEIILVEDGSKDNCYSLCDEYQKKDNRIVVIHKQNGGLSSARNAGLDICKGDYVAFLDSDDYLDLKTYSVMLDFLVKENLDVVCCELSKVNNDAEIERLKFYDTGTILQGKQIAREILLDTMGSQVVKGLYKKDLWKDIRFPIGLLYEDIYTTFKVFAKAEKVGFIAEPFYKYYQNFEGISLTPNPIVPYHQFLGFKEHFECAQKHFKDIENDCCALTAVYAISTCFHYYSERFEVLKAHVEEVENFLYENKKVIKKYKKYPKNRKFAINAFYFSKPLFKLFCRVFYKSGLQKALHYEMK